MRRNNVGEKLVGCCLLGVAVGVLVLLLGLLFPPVIPVGIFISCASAVLMFLVIILDVALFCLRS